MKAQVQVTKTQYTCDGCDYLMTEEQVKHGVRVNVPLRTNDDPDRELEFHFHTLTNRHDCFRYWAHNPRIMTRSLKARDLDEEEVDTFLSLMLYRGDGAWPSPGIERPEAVES